MGANAMAVQGFTAAMWERFAEVCVAAAGVGAGRKAVARLYAEAGDALPEGVTSKLAPILAGKPALPGGESGWLAMMVRAGKVDEDELRAAREIVHVLKLRVEACGGAVPAVDPTKLVVDGGPNPGQRIYGVALSPEVGRYDAWVARVKALPDRSRVLHGKKDSISLLKLVQRVLAEGEGPRALDGTLGVRNGRCGEAVLRELKRYADYHFRS